MEVGDVLYLHNKDIYPEGKKYSICIHVVDGLFLLLNTENRKMYECIPLKKTKDANLFLDHDSHIGCNQVFRYSPEELRKAKSVGTLAYKDLERLYNHILNDVKNMPKIYKDKILPALDNRLDDFR
jgi:hypothetical protein